MAVSVEIISPELWGHLLGKYGREPDIRTQQINQAMLDAFEAGFGVFAQFREGLESQGFRAIRKYLSGIDPESTRDVVILVAENLLHPSTDYPARNERDRYDIPGNMIPGEHTFHPKVATQVRMRTWRRYPDRQEGPPWYADTRIRFWGEVLSIAKANDYGWGRTFTSISFPVDQTSPNQTSQRIERILEAAKPKILAGYHHLL